MCFHFLYVLFVNYIQDWCTRFGGRGRGYFKISELGKEKLKENVKIDDEDLMQYPSFVEFRNVKDKDSELLNVQTDNQSLTPNEIIESTFPLIVRKLQDEIMQQIRLSSPAFFERLVVNLITSMGYGGSRNDAGEAIGRSGDEGIDGVINEDKLGLDKIYIQAKRWQGTVGRPEIQKFVGALHGKHANKGIFITTSNYSPDALIYAKGIESNVILIDGDKLTKLMIEYNVGVSVEEVYELKKLDTDYFSD